MPDRRLPLSSTAWIVGLCLVMFLLTLWPNRSISEFLHLGGLLEASPVRVSYEIVSQCKILLAALSLAGLVYLCREDAHRALRGLWHGLARNRNVLFVLFVILLVSNQFLKPATGNGHLIDGLGGFYANLSMNPFHGIDSNWFYRRVLMPLLAHLLQFKGPLLFGIFSLGLNVILMVLLKEILDRIHRFHFLELLSLYTLSLVNFHFLQLGYPDVLVVILILAVMFLDMRSETRLLLFGLALLTHDMAAVVLLPYLLFCRRTHRRALLTMAAGYVVLWLASHGFQPFELLGSQDTPAVWTLIPDYLDMYFLSFLPALGFLWIPFLGHLFLPWKQDRSVWGRNVLLTACVVLLTLLGTDTGRFAAILLVGCLSLWQVRGINRLELWLLRLSLLILPFFSGLGQRSLYVPDLLLILSRWLDLPTFGFRLL